MKVSGFCHHFGMSLFGVDGEAGCVPLLGRPSAEVAADLAAPGVAVEPGELCGRVPGHGFALSLMGRQNPAMPVSAVVFQQHS